MIRKIINIKESDGLAGDRMKDCGKVMEHEWFKAEGVCSAQIFFTTLGFGDFQRFETIGLFANTEAR